MTVLTTEPPPAVATESDIDTRCRAVRERILVLCATADGGHLGGSMSLVETLTQLYTGVMNVSPAAADDPDRDFFVLSKGHGALCLYSVLAECGWIDDDVLATYGDEGGLLGAHPNPAVPGIEMATGSLGHGLPVALGVALAAAVRGSSRRVFVVLGDGELQEGSNWEAAMYAGSRRVSGLTAVVDRNGLQITGPTEQAAGMEPLADKWRAFGWEVRDVDGHDTGGTLRAALAEPSASGRPVVVIARTEKGHGVAPVAGQTRSHFATLKPAQLRRALDDLAPKGLAPRDLEPGRGGAR